MTTLSDKLTDYIAGAFSGVWIQTLEPQEAQREIIQLCRTQSWTLGSWNLDQGLQIGGQSGGSEESGDPLAAIKAASALTAPDQTSVMVLENFHRFMGSVEIVQAMINQLQTGKQTRSFVIVLSPVVDLPPELEKLFVVIEHELPGRDQLLEIAQGIGTENGELPEGIELDLLLDASGGLTRGEAESAYSLSLVRHGRIQADTIWELKNQTLKKSGLLQMYRGGSDFQSLGGMAALKSFCLQALSKSNARAKPRGVLLLSPPGCGKSQFCKALGRETGRPVINLDVGSLMGSLVGQTEERTRQALRTIDAMQPCLVMIEELDKAFAGVAGSGQSDSGVSARMFGSFLTWLNDRESETFVVCTANDVTKLPPEFARAERFDAVYFLDLPCRKEKNAIWDIYLHQYQIDPAHQRPDDKDWTGAEIKACCRLAVLLDQSLTDTAKNVVPVAVTSAESISRLRSWASGRCLDATAGGIYKSTSAKRRQTLKAVGPPASLN